MSERHGWRDASSEEDTPRPAGASSRSDGETETARYGLERLGIDIRPFYYMRETLPAESPTDLTAAQEGFEFSVFGREEVVVIAEIPEREGYVGKQRVIDNFEKSDTCLGLKEVLRDMGRDTFYSITESSNKPSMRFKEKLGARPVFLGAYVKLFRKWVLRRILRRY